MHRTTRRIAAATLVVLTASSLAASLLRQAGFEDVSWVANGVPAFTTSATNRAPVSAQSTGRGFPDRWADGSRPVTRSPGSSRIGGSNFARLRGRCALPAESGAG